MNDSVWSGLLIALAVLTAILLLLPTGIHAESASAKLQPINHALEAQLGETLFRFQGLSSDGSIACQNCHVPSLGFSGNRPKAVGEGGYLDGRRAPSLLGLAYASSFMWDGRASSLLLQVSMPLDGKEMNVQWPTALELLNADPRVSELAKAAGIELNRDGVLRSLVAYLDSLDFGKSRFERFFYDDDASALTEREVLGFRLFVHKANCASCHLVDSRSAPFTDGGFHITGIGSKDGVTFSDPGRGLITGNISDIGAFKTPSLRGVSLRPFLMHDGSMTSLREVIAYYNGLEHTAPSRLDPRLHSLSLSDEEMEAIAAFLQTLTPANFEKTPIQ